MLCDRSKNLLISIAIVFVIVIIACIVWYHGFGWQTASCKQYGNLLINAPKGISTLRFKNAIFTVSSSTGTVLYSGNVSGVLNDMAKAFAPASNPKLGLTQPVNFELPVPLNPFSFQFPGINDSTARDSTGLPTSIKGITMCSGQVSCDDQSGDSTCANYQENGVSYNLGKCAVTTSSDGTCTTKYKSPSTTSADTGSVCSNGQWVPKGVGRFTGTCQLCPNNLSVTLTLEYRII